MKIVVCYPRSQSAWLSNLLTVPHVSLYMHDVLNEPESMAALELMPFRHKGVVDTGATWDNIPPGSEITVIDNDLGVVSRRVERLFGRRLDSEVRRLQENIESLKPHATVFRLQEMDSWVEEFFEDHVGMRFDWRRYMILKNLYIQSAYARSIRK